MIRGAPHGTLGLANPSGWMCGELMPDVMRHFVQHSGSCREKKTLLLMDNAECHLSLQAIDIAREHGVIILTIPPHCSSRLQPLDVSVYFPFKAFYNSALDSYMNHSKGVPATIYHVAEFVG